MAPMTDNDLALAKLERSARSVSRLSTATKVICVIMLVIAGVVLLYAFSRADRHTDDFIGFSCVALVLGAFATVFWSTAAFHAAFGDSLAVIASAHTSLELLLRAQQQALQQDTSHPRPAKTRKQAPVPDNPFLQPGPPEPAPPPAVEPPPPPSPSPPPAPEEAKIEPATPVKREEQPKPAMKTCRHCDGEIRADATRCRHCFEQV
jgi:hypothetical protein